MCPCAGWYTPEGVKRGVGPFVRDCGRERFSSPKAEVSGQTQTPGGWAGSPGLPAHFLALAALCFASLGFGKSRGKGSPEGGFKGEGQTQDKSRASQVTPGRLQQPAVRAAFRAFASGSRDFGNSLKDLAGVRFWGHFKGENHELASAFPRALLPQRFEAGSIIVPGRFWA